MKYFSEKALEKKIEAIGGGGKTYSAGAGLDLNDTVFSIEDSVLAEIAKISDWFELKDGNIHVRNNRGFWSDSFISAGGLSSGGGAAAGNATLSNVTTTGATISADSVGSIDVYSKGYLDTALAQAGKVQSVVGQTGAVTAAQIGSALISEGYELTDHIYTNGTGLSLAGGEFSVSTEYQAKIQSGEDAYTDLHNWFERINIGTEANPVWAIHVKSDMGFYSNSFVSAGGLSQGGGTAGGNASMTLITGGGEFTNGVDTLDVYSMSRVDQLLATAGTVQTVAGVAPDDNGDVPVADLKTALSLGSAAYQDTSYFAAASHTHSIGDVSGLNDNLSVISGALQTLQAQIDSVATRNDFDELNASSVFSDIVAATSFYAGSIALGGNDLATTLSNLSGRIGTVEGKFTGDSANSALRLAGTSAYSIWGVEYWSSGVPKSVTGRPGLFIGSTQVQTSSATQDLAGIGSITATGALTLSSTKKIYFGDSTHYIELDADGYFHFSHGLYSEGFVTAGGQGTGGGGGGGLVEQIYRIGDFGDTFDANANDTFNAYAINSLHLRMASLEQDHGVTSVGLSMPTGFSVSSSPITASGTLSVSFASGYSLLTSSQISTWNGKQEAISDLTTIRSNASNGNTAYGWGNHANAGYFAASSFTASNIVSTLGNTAVNRATADAAGENIASNFTTVGSALKSLQSQIDSVASRSVYDELTATNLYSDMAVGVSAYFSNFYGNLTGTASNATNADNADKLDGVHASGLFTELTTSAGSTNLYITIGGTRLSKTIYAYYDSDGGIIASNMTTIGTALRSLQSQIDSVATNRSFDDISITSAFVDMLSVGSNVNVGGTIHSIGGIDSNSYITAGATGSSSDARLKGNIEEVSAARAIELLSALKGKEWTWNGKKEYLAGKHGSGLIAQEVLSVMPWAVLDLNGEYSLNYNTLWGVAIPVMQSHEQRIEALERENKELKRKIEILTNNS